MKASAKQYANALYQSTVEASKKELPEIIEQFVLTLRKNNAIGKVDDIMAEFSKLWNAGQDLVEVEAITAQEADSETKHALEAYAKEVTGAKKVELNHRVSPEIIAGFVLRAGDQVFDASAATKLKQLKREIIG
ncbi:ATP synthase F1 subunit delta [Candidatus Falkowbacteria bacterium]|nr:ATP synthase F1 subunit delta [Candidatus Falkowbacteria bacterium]